MSKQAPIKQSMSFKDEKSFCRKPAQPKQRQKSGQALRILARIYETTQTEEQIHLIDDLWE